MPGRLPCCDGCDHLIDTYCTLGWMCPKAFRFLEAKIASLSSATDDTRCLSCVYPNTPGLACPGLMAAGLPCPRRILTSEVKKNKIKKFTQKHYRHDIFFTRHPTGLSTCTVIHCTICKVKKDVTNFDNW